MPRSVGLWVCSLLLAAGCDGAISPEGRRLLTAANQAYSAGDDPGAIKASSGFLRLHPRVSQAGEAHYIRGLARCRAGQPGPGKADLNAALSLARRKDLIALTHAKLGDLAYRDGDMRQAELHYRAALKHVPPGAPPADQAMYRLAVILQRRGDWQEADLLLRRVTYLFPRSELAERAARRVGARRWSVQAGAFTAAAAAERLRARLVRAGLAARVGLELRDGRMMRLVRVGSHATYGAARADLAKVRKVCGDAFIAPSR